ncbi:MAG: AMP-binding protein [Bacteroidetes bacterium]|nr:AMP-binding protein [Bacteroidota bacterium]
MFHSYGPNSTSYIDFIEALKNGQDWMVTTSGSTGEPKKIDLKYSKIKASAERTNAFFKLNESSVVVNCLSHQTIGGIMLTARAYLGNYTIHQLTPRIRPLKDIVGDFNLISMAPLQLHHSLHQDLVKLKSIQNLLIGGGTISEELEAHLIREELTIWNSYGMTETYSHIALRKVGYNGEGFFRSLPNVKLSIEDEQLIIEANGITDGPLKTNDIVQLLTPDTFVWQGRVDFRINSGGMKFDLETLEIQLKKYIKVKFVIWKEPDPELGERIILLITEKIILKKTQLLETIHPYQIPKKTYLVPTIITSNSEKIMRESTYKLKKVLYEGIL